MNVSPSKRRSLRRLTIALALAIGPVAAGIVITAPDHGWRTEYHADRDLDSPPVHVAVEDQISLDPIEQREVPLSREHFAVQWSGWIDSPEELEGYVHEKHRGEMSLSIDGRTILDPASGRGLVDRATDLALAPGPHHIVVRYLPAEGGRRGLLLRWATNGSPEKPLPREMVTPDHPALHRARVQTARFVWAQPGVVLLMTLGLLLFARFLGAPPAAPPKGQMGARAPPRRALFLPVLLLLFYGITELTVVAFTRATAGESFSRAQVERAREGLLDESPRTDTGTPVPAGTALGGRVAVHPFLGYVLADGEKEAPNPYGFAVDAGGRFLYGDDTDYVVAITGGSYAQQIYHYGHALIAKRLEDDPALAGKKIRVISLAIFGYRQPQQVAAVSYYLWVGGTLDVVVNLDGFNEIANNTNRAPHMTGHMHPVYPSPNPWADAARGLPSTEVLAIAGRVQLLRERREFIARLTSPLDFSPTVNTLWMILDTKLEREQRSLEARMALPTDELSYAQAGPAGEVAPEDVDAFTVRLWMTASRQIAELGRASGNFRYLHLLQPNQYVPGSKPLSPVERKHFFDEQGANATNVRRGYPMLQAAGADLRAEGIEFHDMTGVYREMPTTLYSDACCHVNLEGGEIMAEAIADLILNPAPTPAPEYSH